MSEQTPKAILDAGQANRIPDALRRLEFGTLLENLTSVVQRSLTTTPPLVISTNDVNFPTTEQVISIQSMSATVGGNNNTVCFIPEGSALAATASGGAVPLVHLAKMKVDANGFITGVTFSGAPTIPFVEYIRSNTNTVTRIGSTTGLS